MVDTDYNTRKVKLSLIILAFVSIGIALTSLYSWIIIKLEWKAIVFYWIYRYIYAFTITNQ